MAILSFKASANISPSRFVTLSGAKTVAQAGDNGEIIGVAQEGSNKAPLQDMVSTVYAAETGQSLEVYSAGEVCLVEAGGTITAGNLLKSDSQGRAVAIATSGTTIQNYGAVALEGGATGEKILCLVVPLNKVRPALS
ncbi:MAG TPA: DUF2190 family protein [Candidatus Hydrogenedentes bacterium]|nr:DUF2190 family protein [Candidatus Hydrogenedentota bacterium]